MPLFGTQIFLAEAEVDTIYCRQYIRCAYRPPPEAVRVLTGSRILTAVYIYIPAIQ